MSEDHQWSVLKIFVTIIISLFTFLAALYGINTYFENKVDKKVEALEEKIIDQINSPEYTARIASKVRPYLIFNARGSIEIDMGAKQYLEGLRVETGKKPQMPKKVIVSPKEYMVYAETPF